MPDGCKVDAATWKMLGALQQPACFACRRVFSRVSAVTATLPALPGGQGGRGAAVHWVLVVTDGCRACSWQGRRADGEGGKWVEIRGRG